MNKYLMLLLLAVVVVPLGCSSNDDDTQIEWLFVQNASEISLADGVLTLDGVAPTTVFFSDRPERIAAQGWTTEFVANWGKGGGTESFADDAPNASVSIVTEDTVESVVLTLTNPRLDGDVLQYDFVVLEGDEDVGPGAGSLFIDVVGRPLTPVSVAGVGRRSGRRAARRTTARMQY